MSSVLYWQQTGGCDEEKLLICLIHCGILKLMYGISSYEPNQLLLQAEAFSFLKDQKKLLA